jgi:hypothetical protein
VINIPPRYYYVFISPWLHVVKCAILHCIIFLDPFRVLFLMLSSAVCCNTSHTKIIYLKSRYASSVKTRSLLYLLGEELLDTAQSGVERRTMSTVDTTDSVRYVLNVATLFPLLVFMGNLASSISKF